MNRRISVNTGSAVPQSFITKGKQRLKQHIDTVYLNNGDEFEIELYNPKQFKVLARIEVNNQSIGNGIILRPGERIFLERYIDEAKKFLFETYTVNGDNKEVLDAIQNNGDVVVKFYNQSFYNQSTTITTNTLPWNNTFYYNNSSIGTNSTFTTTNFSNNVTYTSTTNNLPYQRDIIFPSTDDSRKLETGRVEKGSHSDQSFTYDSATFEYSPSTTNWWKIKPQSTKPLVREDLVTYCTECGSKRKKDTFKFCPHCGTKF